MWAIFAQRPVARAVAIFAALNLLTVLLFTLLVPGRSQLKPDEGGGHRVAGEPHRLGQAEPQEQGRPEE
ncbi:hypothetical protein Mterra_01826 [Calidithermus terrae]|uniref:Uncharacterized protein n=2 Tax=Calidithermus terrae TaxID=1408545 RepID=A0A399EMQ1_9DEIN|nr:hypothetical protein Mterra_01826 [Calidithermus terrae]